MLLILTWSTEILLGKSEKAASVIENTSVDRTVLRSPVDHSEHNCDQRPHVTCVLSQIYKQGSSLTHPFSHKRGKIWPDLIVFFAFKKSKKICMDDCGKVATVI